MTSTALKPGFMQAPARLYFGQVMHARSRPRQHRFRYRVFSLLIDIDRVAAAGRMSRLFSIGRFNLFSFTPADHGPRDGTSLRAHVEALLRGAGVTPDGGRIDLLCYPRILGYVFNPLSVYYCHDRTGTLVALVYQVHNTFGDAHTYVAPVHAAERHGRVVRQVRAKRMHVSPFVGMAAQYRFALDEPDARLSVHIREHDDAGPFLLATFDGEARPLTTRTLAHAFFRYPLMTLKVIGAIHFEAFRLWRKGVPFHARPAEAPAGSSAEGPPVAPEKTRYSPGVETAA